MTASVITKLEARTEDQTFGRIPYDVEIKGRKIGGVVVNKLPRLTSEAQNLVEVIVPVLDDKTVLALSTMDQIARRILPGAKISMRSKQGPARRMVYAAS